MRGGSTARTPARPTPPPEPGAEPDLPGVDRRWHRWVAVPDAAGAGERRWHLLDGASSVVGPPRGTVLAVHGNPTWSYLWRGVVAEAATAGWRVVAVDQLDMGWSERTGTRRRLAQRVDDLLALTDALGLTGPAAAGAPLVSLGHDWGGLVSAGWALAVRARGQGLAGLTLTNTGVHQPLQARLPAALRVVTAPGVLPVVTVRTPGFVAGTLATSRLRSPADRRARPLAREVAAAYRLPYRRAADRGGVGAFVADIPATAEHPSRPALEAVAAGLADLGASGAVPALVLWGTRDPVFGQRYLDDLRRRLPHADVHRFEGAGHLLPEEADVAGVLTRWLAALPAGHSGSAVHVAGDAGVQSGSGVPGEGMAPHRPMTAGLAERAAGPGRDERAVVQLRPGGSPAETITWAELATRVDETAAGLLAAGARPGERISLLVRPGVDLTVLLYASLRIGLVGVVADAGLGVRGLARAIRGAAPQHLAAVHPAIGLAWALRWPGRRIAVGGAPGGPVVRWAGLRLAAATPLDDVQRRGREALAAGTALPPQPHPDDDAVVIFTSGSTGPAKGVVYTHRRMAAMRDAFGAVAGVGPDTPLVAAFAPFALLGPGLGATSAVPETDVTKPSTLTATALADAVAAVGAAAVFASPAALANVVATAGALGEDHRAALAGVRLLLSAGAPVDPAVLAAAAALLPAAQAHTPYGMTEALPTTDVSLDELLAAPPGDGVLVGRPVAGASVAVAPLDADGRPTGPLTDRPGVTGEVAVSAPHTKDRYDQLWDVQRRSAVDPGWHRTGDVGHLDEDGRLWVEGRLAHVVTTAGGVVTPVGVEQRVQRLEAVRRAAVVGVGPAGTQQVVVVLEPAGAAAAPGPAPLELVAAVRAAAAPVGVAAVLVVAELPTDVRHRSKVDRAAVAAWAEQVLAGRRPARVGP